MPTWWPEWMSAAASSALMMRLAMLEFRTREVAQVIAVDIYECLSVVRSRKVQPITIGGMAGGFCEVGHTGKNRKYDKKGRNRGSYPSFDSAANSQPSYRRRCIRPSCPSVQSGFTFWMKMSFSPLRSSSHATAASPEEAMPADKRNLSAEAVETPNCAHTKLPAPSSFAACRVPEPNPGESTQKTSAPVPICTFSTQICESEPSGTIGNPPSPHWRAPAELNFCPETPFSSWLESSSVQNRKVSCVAGL